MKNLTQAILGFVIITSTLSCKRFLIYQYGIKSPKIENQASLAQYLHANHIDTSEILCFRDTTALINFQKAGVGLPESIFFNRHKQYVNYRSSPKDCNGKISEFLEKIDSINAKIPVEDKSIYSYIEGLSVCDTNEKFILNDYNYDFYMIIYWAKYLGKLNKDKVFEWQELITSAREKGVKIRVVLVSADYQNNWGITKEQLPKFDFK